MPIHYRDEYVTIMLNPMSAQVKRMLKTAAYGEPSMQYARVDAYMKLLRHCLSLLNPNARMKLAVKMERLDATWYRAFSF